jgi:transcriptional regulator with XRE-family HTH domain
MSYGYSARLIDLNKKADPKLLGVRLGKMCIKHGMSVAEVAELLSVSRQTVYNWFIGSSNPQNIVVDAVERLLVSFDQK